MTDFDFGLGLRALLHQAVAHEAGVEAARPPTDHEDDLAILAVVGRMYLNALDDDPENEMLTLVGALKVAEVREAVERQEARTAHHNSEEEA